MDRDHNGSAAMFEAVFVDSLQAVPKALQTRALIQDNFDDRKGLIVSPSAWPYMKGKAEQCLDQFSARVDTVMALKK